MRLPNFRSQTRPRAGDAPPAAQRALAEHQAHLLHWLHSPPQTTDATPGSAAPTLTEWPGGQARAISQAGLYRRRVIWHP